MYLARESGTVDVANQMIYQFTERFYLISEFPHIGRHRDDLRPGLRSFAIGSYVILYRVEKSGVRILHVIHGSRDIPALLNMRD